MSTVVLHNTAVIAGCRAASSTRTRVVSVVRAPSAVRIATTPGALKTTAANRDWSRSTIVRASEDEAPAAESAAAPAAREPEEDSEEVKGAKLTAIVTGARRRPPTHRRQLFLLSRRAELSTPRRRGAKDADPSRPFNPDPQAS